MRYELTDYEWAAIKPFLPNKPRPSCPRPTPSRIGKLASRPRNPGRLPNGIFC